MRRVTLWIVDKCKVIHRPVDKIGEINVWGGRLVFWAFRNLIGLVFAVLLQATH